MSPEQVRDTGKVDIRADIYSLGVVFYEMLSAKRPYSGNSAVTVLLAVAEGKEPPPDLAELRPGLPADTVAMVRRMMARDPEERPRTASALLTELRALGAASASQALGSALASTVPPPPRPDSPVSAAPTLPAGIAATPESWAETIPMDATGAPTAPEKAVSWRRFLPWVLATMAALIAVAAVGVAWAVSQRVPQQPAPLAPTPPAAESQPTSLAVAQTPEAPSSKAPTVAQTSEAPSSETPAVAQTPEAPSSETPAVAQTPEASSTEATAVAQKESSADPAQAEPSKKPRSRIITPSELTTEELVELERARILRQAPPSSKNMFGIADDLEPDPAYIILRSEPADDDAF